MAARGPDADAGRPSGTSMSSDQARAVAMTRAHDQASPHSQTMAERLAGSPTTGERLAGREADPPSGLTGAEQGLVDTGYRTLVDSPQLTVRYETTTSAINGKGGVSAPARAHLESFGIIMVADVTHPTPSESRMPAPGQSANAVNSFNGDLASQAIADRLATTPAASNIELEVCYVANLKRVDPATDSGSVAHLPLACATNVIRIG